MIKGQIKNIGLPPIGFKDLDSKENYIPFHVDIRNGNISRAGNWEKRNGYSEQWSVSLNESIDLLIPESVGYAITQNRSIYKLTSTPQKFTGVESAGTSRPQWVWGLDSSGERVILIVDGSIVTKLNETTLVASASSGKNGSKFIGRVGPYTLYAGYDDTEFTWSASNNSENITTGDSGTTNVKKTGKIKFARDFRNKWIVFKDNEIEVWYNQGSPFARLNESTIPVGLGASYSVVEANQTLYFMDSDKKFRVINGNRAELVSGAYESYIFDKIQNPEEVYGINYEKEHCIRWFSPLDGICLKYDYENKFFSEDNHWEHGMNERLPHNSYMELDGKQYFGDYNPTGKVFEWSDKFKDDNGRLIRVLRDFRIKLTESGNGATVNKLKFEFEQGVDSLTETSPEVIVRWSFDNQSSEPEWNSETLSLNISPDFDPYAEIFGLGTGRIMRIQIIETDSVKFSMIRAVAIIDEKVI